MSPDTGGWIDVHHHSFHHEVAAALQASGVTEMTLGVPVPRWSAAESLAVMDTAGIAAAVVSIVLPAGKFDRPAICRQGNELSAAVVADHPGRFAALAMLPLPDVDAALAELGHALDVLRLDGVVLETRTCDGRMLSDPAFGPVFDELDRRGAVVFLHPSPAARCMCTGGPEFAALVPPVLVDFVMDTTRAVAGLLYGGTLRRCPRIRFVVAHSGGTVPYLAARLELGSSWQVAEGVREQARDTPRQLARLYYETAQAFAPGTLACLRAVTGESHVLFGTDYPMLKDAAVTATVRALTGNSDIKTATVGRENALALFPSLRR